jgi:hypothetical protein
VLHIRGNIFSKVSIILHIKIRVYVNAGNCNAYRNVVQASPSCPFPRFYFYCTEYFKESREFKVTFNSPVITAKYEYKYHCGSVPTARALPQMAA